LGGGTRGGATPPRGTEEIKVLRREGGDKKRKIRKRTTTLGVRTRIKKKEGPHPRRHWQNSEGEARGNQRFTGEKCSGIQWEV